MFIVWIDYLLSIFGYSFLFLLTFIPSGNFHLSLVFHLFIRDLRESCCRIKSLGSGARADPTPSICLSPKPNFHNAVHNKTTLWTHVSRLKHTKSSPPHGLLAQLCPDRRSWIHCHRLFVLQWGYLPYLSSFFICLPCISNPYGP